MNQDETIKYLTDTNFRLLLLLGYATSIVFDYKELEAYHDKAEKCNWFFQAIQAVVYENKPIPPMP